MEIVNNCFENLNQEVKHLKVLRKVEKQTGIEPGSIVAICLSILFSLVFFNKYSRFICEVEGLVYPGYKTVRQLGKYWYTYWITYSVICMAFMVLPNWPILYAIRFLVTIYLAVPGIGNSILVHEKLMEKVYSQLKPS